MWQLYQWLDLRARPPLWPQRAVRALELEGWLSMERSLPMQRSKGRSPQLKSPKVIGIPRSQSASIAAVTDQRASKVTPQQVRDAVARSF